MPDTHGSPANDPALAHAEDRRLLAAICDGDEAAFTTLTTRYQSMLDALARLWTRDAAIAGEVVEETWLAMLEGIEHFVGRSSVRTWLCGLLVNVARARSRKQAPSVPPSLLDGEGQSPAVDPARFQPEDHPWAGHWLSPPEVWPDVPEQRLLGAELRGALEAAIQRLPEPQREVLLLRDVHGLSGDEVCDVLGLTGADERVLRHRARSNLRNVLEGHFAEANPR